MKINIAIDGPGAAGKSTIAKLLASQREYIHLDTGAMYRCCAYEAHQKGIDIENEHSLSELMNTIQIVFKEDNQIYVNGCPLTNEIRSNENGMRASLISQKKIVRQKLVFLQQQIAKEKGYILDGRDIGTVVLPNAELKIFLIASVESRAQRRYKELIKKGLEANIEEIARDLQQRDYQDMNRDESPLKKADDAIEVDTSKMSIQEVCTHINGLIDQVLESRK